MLCWGGVLFEAKNLIIMLYRRERDRERGREREREIGKTGALYEYTCSIARNSLPHAQMLLEFTVNRINLGSFYQQVLLCTLDTRAPIDFIAVQMTSKIDVC